MIDKHEHIFDSIALLPAGFGRSFLGHCCRCGKKVVFEYGPTEDMESLLQDLNTRREAEHEGKN